jgi:hypothetical protein
MKKLVLIILGALVMSCGNDAVPRPQHLLKERDMVNILYDISLLQAIKSFTPKSLNQNNVEPSKYIYNKYKIDSLTFAENHLYYASNLEKYEKIQKEVAEKIKKNKAQFTTKAPKTPKIATLKTGKPITGSIGNKAATEKEARSAAIRALKRDRKGRLNKASKQ